MKPYALDQIIISPDRHRQEFDAQALEDLRDSIDGKRLYHAPVVRQSADGPVLVAGERRLRVIRDIFELGGHFFYDGVRYEDQVPTVTLGELTFLEAEEAELDENLKRRDLTWQEHASAVERLDKLRGAQAAERGEVHTLANTVAELRPDLKGANLDEMGWSGNQVRKEIIIARHLHKPEVAAAKTLDDAWKVLKRSDQSAANIALAQEVGKTFTAELHQLVQGDCLTWMMNRNDTSILPKFDVILTDPPYGMGADRFGDAAGKLTGIEHRYDDSHEAWKMLMGEWAMQSFHITKPEAHAYVFCDFDRFHELKGFMESAGWYVFRTPIIDRKLRSGRVPLPDRGPRRTYELVLYAIKGEKPVTHIYDDVIDCEADKNMTHGAQKPVALYQNLLMRSVRPGDKVLDTFAGSGTIFDACHAMQCVATGIEMNPEYYGMCLNRLRALKAAADPLSELTEA